MWETLYYSEKDEMWQKKDLLEGELSNYRERPAERWITDTEVDRCTNCNELFSITRRKVKLITDFHRVFKQGIKGKLNLKCKNVHLKILDSE